MGSLLAWTLLLSLPHALHADVYLNNPAGSNNKLNEDSNNNQRDTNNRLFDDQNNNNGGYHVGDNCTPGCMDDNSNNAGDYNEGLPGAGQGKMAYGVGSEVYVEWYAQHGCGVDHPNVYCQIVLQYMCKSDNPELKDGSTTARIDDDPNEADNVNRGQHEDHEFYRACKARARHDNLYIADQNLGAGAINTRQENNGQNNRQGLECNEERDYYPYWHPSPWHDFAVLTHEPETRCELYWKDSQNVAAKGYCDKAPTENNDGADVQQGTVPNSQGDCEAEGETWVVQAAFGEPPPDCIGSVVQRDNNNGNAQNGQPIYYLWNVPGHILEKANDADEEECVMRLRYNISTADFDTDSTVNTAGLNWDAKNRGVDPFYMSNAEAPDDNNEQQTIPRGQGIVMPQDPRSDFMELEQMDGEAAWKLQLQVNTDQFGRTFQDRTHTFKIRRQSQSLQNQRVLNYNVRGRRGNINQVYPSVEYDFVPSELVVEAGTYLHFQWTGSDANPNNNDGNGRQATDRNNMVQIKEREGNVPLTWKNNSLFCTNIDEMKNPFTSAYWLNTCEPDIRRVADFGFIRQHNNQGTPCDWDVGNNGNGNNNVQNCYQLNNAPAYFDGGTTEMRHLGAHSFVSTRNNDFTNRSQKSSITIIPRTFTPLEAAAYAGGAVLVTWLLLYLGMACIALNNPRSWMFSKRYRPRIISCLCPNMEKQGEEARRENFRAERAELKQNVIEMTSAFAGASEPAPEPDKKGGRGAPKSKAKAKAKAGAKGDGDNMSMVSVGPDDGKEAKGTAAKTERPACCSCCCGWMYWLLLNCCVFYIGFYMHYGLEIYMGHLAYPVAKGGGFILDLNLAMLILPMLKSLQTALRGGKLDGVVPGMDDPHDTHIFLAKWVFVGAVIHIAAHVVLMIFVANTPKLQRDSIGLLDIDDERLSLGFRVWEQALSGPRYVHLTGAALTLWMGLIFLTARPCIRRATCVKSGFKMFMWFHKTWPLVYLTCLVHAPARLWIWFFFPFMFVWADFILGQENRRPFAALIAAQLKTGDVLCLTFEIPEGFAYQAGQYITLSWNADGVRSEWHPFTLTSAPEENVLSVNIRSPKSLDWCSALRNRLMSEAPMTAKLKNAKEKPDAGTIVTYGRAMEMRSGTIFSRPKAVGKDLANLGKDIDILDVDEMNQDSSFVDEDNTNIPLDGVVLQIQGPFGAPAQHVWDYDTVLVVGSGIGVTPFVSILRSVQLRCMQRNAMLGRKDNESPFTKAKGGGAGEDADPGVTRRGVQARGKNYDTVTASIPNKTREQLIEEIIPVPRNMKFVWIVKSMEEVTWFYDLLAEAVEGPYKDNIEVQIHLTETVELKQVKSMKCANRQFYGRPKWGNVFQEMKGKFPNSHIGVFLCGSPAIGEALAENSKKHSEPPRMTFTFYKESF